MVALGDLLRVRRGLGLLGAFLHGSSATRTRILVIGCLFLLVQVGGVVGSLALLVLFGWALRGIWRACSRIVNNGPRQGRSVNPYGH